MTDIKAGTRRTNRLRSSELGSVDLEEYRPDSLRNVSLENLSTVDSAILLGNARLLLSAAEARQTKTMLRGKKLALLCESEESADAVLFRSAASDLGAHVSHVRLRLSKLSQPDELQHTARVLGRLHDGIECQGMARALVEVVGREAGVPVYDGIASPRHPTASLAAMLGGAEDSARMRELVVQKVLLSTLA